MAMVNHDDRVIFLHNPKTAGTSIMRALEQRGYVMHWEDDRWGGEVDQHAASVPDEFIDYHSFAVWRNPFDRVISLWSFHVKHATCSGPADLLSYITRGLRAVDDPTLTASMHCFHDYWTQARYVFLAKQLIPYESINGSVDVDGLGEVPLGRVNTSSHSPWREYYNDALADLVLYGSSHDFDVIERRTGLDLRESWRDS